MDKPESSDTDNQQNDELAGQNKSGTGLPKLPKPNDIDRSAWVSGLCYSLALLIGFTLNPNMEEDIVNFTTGTYILIAGVSFFFATTVYLQKYMRFELTATTFGHPNHLVTSGPFAISRNPIYLCFLVPLACLAYYSLVAALISIVAYLIGMTYYVIRPEERVLTSKFGDEFIAYRAKVPCWIFFRL